jgi:hypothetical protein
MSTVNIYCQEIHYGEILPGVNLVKAGTMKDPANAFIADNGVEFSEGRYGLTLSGHNGPDVTFRSQPIKNVYRYEFDGLPNDLPGTEEQKILMSNCTAFTTDLDLAPDKTRMAIEEACEAVGWKREFGYIGSFVSNRIARFVEDNEPVEIYDQL